MLKGWKARNWKTTDKKPVKMTTWKILMPLLAGIKSRGIGLRPCRAEKNERCDFLARQESQNTPKVHERAMAALMERFVRTSTAESHPVVVSFESITEVVKMILTCSELKNSRTSHSQIIPHPRRKRSSLPTAARFLSKEQPDGAPIPVGLPSGP